MSRIARVVAPDVPHHIVQRDVRKMDAFSSDADREEYLSLLCSVSAGAGGPGEE